MPKYRGSRIEARIYNKPTASGRAAWYADFRDLGKFGGKLEALKAYGSRVATADREEATLIASRRLRALRELEGGEVAYSPDKWHLGALFAQYLSEREAEADRPTQQWLLDMVRHADRAIEFFTPEFNVREFKKRHIDAYVKFLKAYEHSRGVGFSEGSIHQHLGTLSGMYAWGIGEELIPGGNKVNDARRGAKGKIRSPNYRISDFLDWDEITEILKFTAAMQPGRSDEFPHLHERIAFGFYTGARDVEIKAVGVHDVLFDRDLVRITNAKRGFDGGQSQDRFRYVPLFPHLAEIIKNHLESDGAPRNGLLFVNGSGGPANDPRRLRERIPLPKRFLDPHHPLNVNPDDPPMSLGWRMTRHSYCSARLQTLDHGEPISKFTVQKEMGHGSSKMIDGIYGHVGSLRLRKPYLDFR